MSSWLLLCVASVLAIIASFVHFRTSRFYRLLSKIPGPPGLPLLGNFLSVASNTDRIMDYCREMCHKYGNISVAWLGPFPFVAMADPRDLEILLNKNECQSKPAPYKALEMCFGYSALTANRADWKRYRKIMHSSFSTQTLETFVPAFNEKARVLTRIIEEQADGREFDILSTMMVCTLDIVTQTSLGTSMNLLEDNRVELAESFDIARDLIFSACFRPWCWVPAIMKNTSTYKNMVSGFQTLWDFAEQIINSKFSSHESNEISVLKKEADEDDAELKLGLDKNLGFMDNAISSMKMQSDLLTRTELKDNTITVIIGGMDTSSITMSVVLMLLGLHQDVQRKVVDELREIFGNDMSREVTVDDLKRMVYLEQVINETLRLYPPLPSTGRAVEEEVKLSNYTIPKGSNVVICLFVLHRNPEIFPDPDKFDPDRFSAENCANRHPYSFIPFLSGRRMCVGKKYAYMQMKTLLSTVLRKYTLLPCGSREDMEHMQFKLTLHFKNGCKVKLAPRVW